MGEIESFDGKLGGTYSYKFWYSPSYNFVTAGRVQQYAYYHIPNLRIQLVQNASDDGPMRSETCRANISAK